MLFNSRLKLPLALALCGGISLLLAAGASGAVVTYPGTGLPDFVDNGETSARTTVVPAGRPPATDIDIVTLNISAALNSTEQSMQLTNPAGVARYMILLGCSTYDANAFALDQQAAGNPFGGGGTCPPASGASYKPSSSPASSTPLTDLLGPSSGTWTMTYDDPGASNPPSFDAIILSWALKITHAPLDCSATAKKQKLGKKLRYTLTCNGNATLTPGKDAKANAVPVVSGEQALTAKLKGSARERLEDGGKAKLKLAATNDLGETDSSTLKVKIKP